MSNLNGTIVHRKYSVTRGEVWFDNDPPLEGVDLLEYYYRSAPLEGCRCVDYRTILIDLTQDEKTLMADIQSKTRQYIRRMSENPELVYESWNPASEEMADRLLAVQDELVAQKKLQSVDRNVVLQYARSGHLDISHVRKTDGTPLSWHSHFCTPERYRALHSIALFRANSADHTLVGRAHRYHTWRDIQRFKAAGIPVLDMGGFYSGKTDEGLLRVNEFKSSFGGTIVADYLCERPLTIKGKLYAGLRRLMRAGPFNNQPLHS